MKKTFKIVPFALIAILVLVLFPFPTAITAGYSSPISPPFMKLSSAVLSYAKLNENTEVDVLVETFTHDYAPVVSTINSLGGSVKFQFKYVNCVAASVPANQLLALANDPDVAKVYHDQLQTLSYSDSLRNDNPLEDVGYRQKLTTFLSHIDPASLDVPLEEKLPLQDDDSLKITLTPEQIMSIEPNTYWNPVAMDAVDTWRLGDFGQGSLVVVIDTGIYPDHFMLRGSVIGGVDLSPDVGTEYEGWNLTTNHWHGTHVAGIIAGHGAILVHSSNPLYRSISMYTTPPPEASSLGYPGYHVIPLLGIAPAAKLYAVKVFPHTGAGIPESIVLQGIEYAINLTLVQGYDVDAISMSLGGPTVFDGRDLEDLEVDYATSVGITVVAAAGNEGPARMTVSSPGSAETAITVGAAAHPINTRVFWDLYYGKQGIGWQLFTSETPQIHALSSRGPTSDGRDKPDIAATGLFVLSAYVDWSHNITQGLAFASGTSMATPAVSGAVALLNTYAEVYISGATPLDYKQAIKNGAVWLDGYNKYDQGAGYLNASNALIALTRDTSIGDLYPPLPNTYALADITNIPIVESGVYEGSIADLKPGLHQEYIFNVTEATNSITLEITNVENNVRNPYGLNSFEIYIQSAKRTMYAYWIETANVWGNAKFIITDHGTTWSGAVTGVYQDPYTIATAIEPGYVKIVIENDWTSSGPVSCNFKINVTAAAPIAPDETYTGSIELGRWTVFNVTTPPTGTNAVILELWWENDWSKYPTSDLDMYVKWFNGTEWIWEPFYEGATLNSPERVIIESPTIQFITVYINGYAIYTGSSESWTLKVYYS